MVNILFSLIAIKKEDKRRYFEEMFLYHKSNWGAEQFWTSLTPIVGVKKHRHGNAQVILLYQV